MNQAFENNWRRAWALLGLGVPASEGVDDLFQVLCSCYAEPHRKYHTLQHLGECLALCEQDSALARYPGEVAIGLWFHDAVYAHGQGDNEAASADWARRVLLRAGAGDEVASRVHALVMATRHSQLPASPDEQLLVDIDLSILGAGPARFAEYQQQIRQEFAHVPDAVFAAKRQAVLRAFMARKHIFSTPDYRHRFEAAARDNLRAALG
jgi:predicted metal-dependent HD superfamily phosphohydrolase